MLTSVLLWLGLFAYAVLITSTAVVVVLENRQPAKTIAWLIVLIGLPVIGWVFFYFFGQDERRKHLLNRKNYRRITQRMLSAIGPQPAGKRPEKYAQLIRLQETRAHAAFTSGNELRLLPDGRAFLQALLRDIYAAKRHIHIEMYIFEDDAVGRLLRDALADRARDGVEVRVLYDDVGCWNVPNAFFADMERRGILVGAFLPVRFPSLTRRANYRNHQKICVIDGRCGYIGGMNIALRYVTRRDNNWRDLQLRVECNGAAGLQHLFLSNWYFATGRLRTERRYFHEAAPAESGHLLQIVASSPISRFPEIMYSVTWMAQNARKYLYIETPYLMPTEPVLQALQTAAMAGVDVRIVLPLKPDAFWLRWANESYFDDILRAGIRIYLYEEGFMHAKAIVTDDDCCSIGSTNMDFRSFENNFEANAFVYGPSMAADVKAVICEDMRHSREIKLGEWRKRPTWRKFLESHTRILSPLL